MNKLLIPAIFIFLAVTGCSNTGAFLSANQTIVNLEDDNFTVEATNVTGESSAGYLIGLSYSNGLIANSIALARVHGNGTVYAEAINDLWDSYEDEHGNAEDKRVALTNIRYDSKTINLLLYTQVKVIVRADVVRFE